MTRRGSLVVAACLVLLAAPLASTTLLQLDLADLTQRADKIFRGTVVDVIPGTTFAGGGELPTTTYRLRVDESLKGGVTAEKNGVAMIEIEMVGSIKGSTIPGRFDVFADVPRLQMGGDYLLFTTPESAIGLSTTVGLGQGAFSVFPQNHQDMAVNAFNNAGLGLGSAGEVSYDVLKAAVLALLGQ